MAETGRRLAAPSRILVMLLGALSLLGCAALESGPVASPTGRGATAVSASAPDLAAFLAALTTARSDRTAWTELLDARDPGFSAEAEQLRENLTQLDVRMATAGRTHPLPPQRRKQLGPTATVQAVRVDWAVRGQAPVAHDVWLTLTTEDHNVRLAGLSDGPAGGGPIPLWLLEHVRVVTGDGVAVLVGEGIDPDLWLSGLDVARADLGRRGLSAVPLIAQVPSEVRDFERVLGVRPSSHRSVAAAAWPFGEVGVHIVINPRAGAATVGEARQVLLTHEAVHVATKSARRKGPLWLSEGYADLIALSAHPAVAAVHERHLAEDQRRHGIATELVSGAELDPANPRVDAHYQRAWLTVRVLDRGNGTADRIHAAVQAGTPLDRALADEGWTETTLASEVHAELTRLAG